MRKIEFTPPVEAMRGNMSGSQVLKYAENMNPAWDAPDGLQTAKNYTARYIGARRSKDGAVYFSVKRKASVMVNEENRIRQAALGCIAATVAWLKDEDHTISPGTIPGTVWGFLVSAYKYCAAENGIESGKTLEQWVKDELYYMYANQQELWNVATRYPGVQTLYRFNISNPFGVVSTETGYVTPVLPQQLYNKFMQQLHCGSLSIVIFINKQAIGSPEGIDFEEVIGYKALATTHPNYKSLITPLEADGEDVAYSNKPLKTMAGEAVPVGTEITDGTHYTAK